VLIVARRKGQRIKIGENIEVVVTEVSRGEVRLGIVAPKTVSVVREEMQRAVEDANRAAAASTLCDASAGNEISEISVVSELGVMSELGAKSAVFPKHVAEEQARRRAK